MEACLYKSENKKIAVMIQMNNKWLPVYNIFGFMRTLIVFAFNVHQTV